MKGPKLSNFKIRGATLQNGENMGAKTAIKTIYIAHINLLFREYINQIIDRKCICKHKNKIKVRKKENYLTLAK